MIKVFENFDLSRVGQMQSLLEAHGIATFLKNQYASSVMGEVPFVEVCPQLFILDPSQQRRACQLIEAEQSGEKPGADWLCRHCRSEVEGHFSHCWNCGKPQPA